MADTDYYKMLGVAKTATADEIRKAYRKLVRENHPDANKDNPAAVEKFKQVQEAYDVLNDAEKRKQYDRFGSAFQQAGRGGAGPNPFGGGGGFQGFGGAGPIDLGDLFGQGVDLSEFFGGTAAGGSARRGKRGAARGEDVRATVRVPFTTAVNGGSVDVRIDRGESIETLAVKVPAGVNSGQVVRLAGQGSPGGRGGVNGDLLLQVEVDPHPYFRREGSNLLVDVPITPSEAVIGCKVEVPTMNDGLVVLTIPPGTSSGVKLRLRGKGILDHQTKVQGDQFVVVKIVVPKEMSDADRSLYKKLAEIESSPPDGPLERMMQTGTVTTESEPVPEREGRRNVADEAAKDRERQKVILGGMVLIVGLLLMSVLLILLIAMWGYRLRRQLRESRVGSTRPAGGDFWFLKPKANLPDDDLNEPSSNESRDIPPPHLPPPAEPS